LALACARINHYRRQATLAKLTEAIDVQTGRLGQIEIEKYEEIEGKLRGFLEAEASGQVIRERGRVMTSEIDDDRESFILPSTVEHEQSNIVTTQTTKKRTLADMKMRYASAAPVSSYADSAQDVISNETGSSSPSDHSSLADTSHQVAEKRNSVHAKRARLAVMATGGVGREGSAAAARKLSPQSTVGTFMTLSLPQSRFISVSNGASLVKTSVGGVIDPSFDSKNRGRVNSDEEGDDDDNEEPVEADADAGFNLQSVEDVFAGRRWDGVRKEWVVEDS
jgi:hypothetical protein